jgi:hypothetical protein
VKLTNCAIILLAIMALETAIGEQINPLLNYQGYLADTLGQPYPDGVHLITFTIYDDSLSGQALWSETQQVETSRGLLHAYLGEDSPFPDGLFETYPLWLGIAYESDPEFQPRLLLSSAATAFYAANAARLQGHSADEFADTSQVQSAISDHQSDAAAHHEKTTDAGELISGTLNPDRLPQIDSEVIATDGVATHNLADSSVTGDKIAAGAVSSEHLSATSFTGENIVDGSLHSEDIADGTVESVDIAPNSVTSYNINNGSIQGEDIATATISGIKILDGSIGMADLGYSIVGTAQLVDNSVRSIDVMDGTLTADDMQDEPGVDYTSSAFIVNVNTTVQNWMNVTISAPGSGFLIAWFNCTAEITSSEVAQAGICSSPTSMGSYGEARITSTAISTIASMNISVSEVFPVAVAGDVTLYANVRASASSAGPVDFSDGRFQVIFVPTSY